MKGKPFVVPAARSCNWSRLVDINGKHGYSAGINIRGTQGLRQVNRTGLTVTRDDVGRHPGLKLKSQFGDCLVVMGVTATSRVDVVVSVTPDQTSAQACAVANGLARVIAPRLPASSRTAR